MGKKRVKMSKNNLTRGHLRGRELSEKVDNFVENVLGAEIQNFVENVLGEKVDNFVEGVLGEEIEKLLGEVIRRSDEEDGNGGK